jgi:hypothetical protein
MSKNINRQVIGYIDEDGFSYCLKHSHGRCESIYNDPTIYEHCSVCGEIIEGNIDMILKSLTYETGKIKI